MKIKPSHPALSEKRTIFIKGRKNPYDTPNVLKPVSNNNKIGKRSNRVKAKKWQGMPMFSLTLEERATCPTTCFRWVECYGNNMPFAHRYEHGELLETRLTDQLTYLARKYPGGFVVRLHILGDFYSVDYVSFWASALKTFPSLHIFGYTAHTTGKDRDWETKPPGYFLAK